VKNNTSNIDYKEKYKEAQAEITKLKAEISNLKSKSTEKPILFTNGFVLNETVKLFADLLPFVVSILDSKANYIYVNKFGLNLFGYTNKDIQNGLNLQQLLVDKGEISILSEKFKNAGENDNMSDGRDIYLKKQDGSTLYGLIYSSIIINSKGERNMLGFVINHEKYRKVNKNYIEVEEELRHLNATKDKFFSIVAHDLKNPFNAIIGFSELIINNIEEYSKYQIESFVNVINKSSEKGYILLENLLEWSRSQSGKLKINKENFEISELIKENIDLISEKAEQKGVKLLFDNNNKYLINADKNMINTVVRNLLSNALKFTKEGGKISIKTKIIQNLKQKGKNCFMVEVSDTGVGVENDDINKIFDIEYGISKKGTNSEKGTGLGLVLCKDFIEKNNGKIWAESELNKGSSFFFTLPLN